MADIDSGSGGSKKDGKKVRSKKSSTKVDMTPMVDLAFLLITFFMLTTTLSKPQAMQVNMPDKNKNKPEEKQEIKESQAMTIILGENDKLYYYTGIKEPKVSTSDYSAEGIRTVLNRKNKEVKDLVVVIKAMEKSKFKNVVDILDEMHITDTKRYAIVDITPQDIELTEKEDQHATAEGK